MSEETKSKQKQRSNFRVLLLATILSVVGACAVGGSVALQDLFARRFPTNIGFNATRPFNATRTLAGQVVAQRAGMSFAYASWLDILGVACLVIVAIILIVLLFGNRSSSVHTPDTKQK